MMIVIEIYG